MGITTLKLMPGHGVMSRLTPSLIIGVAVISLGFSIAEDRAVRRSMRQELDRRAEMLADGLTDSIESRLTKGAGNLQRMVAHFGSRAHLLGLAVCDADNTILAMTSGLDHAMSPASRVIEIAKLTKQSAAEYIHTDQGTINVYAKPLYTDDVLSGVLVIVHDATYIDRQRQQVWRRTFLRVVMQSTLLVLLTYLIVQSTVSRPVAQLTLWMKGLRGGRVTRQLPKSDVFGQLATEVESLVQSLAAERVTPETNARLPEAREPEWTADRLGQLVRSRLQGNRLFVVSNREPYLHVRQGGSVTPIVPASGLVTALEPVLCACDGTWIAHGSGNADTEVVDDNDRLKVPPGDRRYTLRRIWLTKDEEQGYYYGFANEGLWPLCHIAYTRPIFRSLDWQFYRIVNEKFAQAVLEEVDHVESPLVLVQDYHLALVPRLIKDQRPDIRVAIFWHIPWPNPETFSICPWQRELVHGLLGADLIGFHIQMHCNHFLQTVDSALETRIEWERSSVYRGSHRSTVLPFPISVEPCPRNDAESSKAVQDTKREILRQLGTEATAIGIGVDRVDYTKGILERFRAVERFLEKAPRYQGGFSLIQISAPSRTHIRTYRELFAEIEAEAERINWRFGTSKWKPIIFRKGQHSHEDIVTLYRIADVCLVTSLHDGMNLVAKEFVAAREDVDGVLVLSIFTGAARELREALLINPYDVEQTADAIHLALEMNPEERKMRMERLRNTVQEYNVYRWAGSLIDALYNISFEVSGSSSDVELRKPVSKVPTSHAEVAGVLEEDKTSSL